ncbi:hypothetical protein Tco_0556675 [Tanacetum coccineum]
MLAQVGNQGNVGNQNGNVVNENVLVYTDRFHELARLVPNLVTPESRMIERSIKKVGKKGNVGEPSKDENGRDDYKRTRTRNAFATTANPVGRVNTGFIWQRKVHIRVVVEEETIRCHGRNLILEKSWGKAQTKSHLSITSNDFNIELNKEFLEELQVNAYHGWIDKDVINHIGMVLKMIDSIYILGVDFYQL